MPPLSVHAQLGVQRISVVTHPLFCLMQPHVSPGPTVHLCPRLRLGCLHLLRRPCRPLVGRVSFRPGHATVEPPPQMQPMDSTTLIGHRRHLTSRRADTAPDSDSFSHGRFVRRPHRPCFYSADPARHLCSQQCYSLGRCALVRRTFEHQHSRRSP